MQIRMITQNRLGMTAQPQSCVGLLVARVDNLVATLRKIEKDTASLMVLVDRCWDYI